jgi:hypothetical protein
MGRDWPDMWGYRTLTFAADDYSDEARVAR